MLEDGTWNFWYEKKGTKIEPEIPDLARRVKEASFPKALDAGCGGGRHTAYLAREGFEVWGIDQSKSALERTEALLTSEGLRAHLALHDFRSPLPYADCFFGLVIATHSIHHMLCLEVAGAFHEINRVLAPGGYLFLQVRSMEGEEVFLTSGGSNEWKVKFVDEHTVVSECGPEKGVPHHYFTEGELHQLLPDYAFEDLHSKSDHYDGYCLVARKNRAPTPRKMGGRKF